MDWVVTSIVLSVVLTVVLNVALRAFPRTGERVARPDLGDRGIQVWFPWKGMLVVSLGLTVVLNLLLWLT